MRKNLLNNKKLLTTYEPIPIEKNIEYVFERIIISLILAIGFDPYSESHDKFEKTLKMIINWIKIYSNSKKLDHINENEFFEIQNILFELDEKYMLENEWYAQQAYEWFLQLGVLLEKGYNKGVGKNEI